MCISLARHFTLLQGLHIRLGIEIMVWDGRHHLCAIHVVNGMHCVVFDCCDVCCVDVLLFLNMLFWGLVQPIVERPPFFISQMAVGFSNAVRTDVSSGVFIVNTRNPVFYPFVLFQAMCSGSVWFTWLKCSNHFALLLQCNHCLVFGDVLCS